MWLPSEWQGVDLLADETVWSWSEWWAGSLDGLLLDNGSVFIWRVAVDCTGLIG